MQTTQPVEAPAPDKAPCTTCGRACVPHTNSGACQRCFFAWLNHSTPGVAVRCHNLRTADEMENERETCYGECGGLYDNGVRALEDGD